jgi:flagellar biosynthesis protein FlhG
MNKDPVIIPVAAGKGGVGKSLFSANLALALAQAGHRTLAMDLDLGGSNLHHFLGIPNQYPGVGDFLKTRRNELVDFIVPTSIPELSFIPGDGKTPFMANIAYTQKMKLIRRIKKLSAEYIILDLGAGSAFNTLDFFGLGKHGITITTPDYPAVISMLGFLKNFLIRAIGRNIAKNRSASLLLKKLVSRPIENQIPSIEKLRQELIREEPEADVLISKAYRECRPRVIFNRGTGPEDAKMASQISNSLQNILNIEADYFGFILEDPQVNQSVRKRVPLLTSFPDSVAARSITRIAERIVKYWGTSIPNSAQLIFQHVTETCNQMKR